MTDARLIDRFLAGEPVKPKHKTQLAALWARGEILEIEGQPYRRVTHSELQASTPYESPERMATAGVPLS
jgi:hypothetical protein